MASRASWKGTLAMGLVRVDIEAFKAEGKYAGNYPISELCECHQQPIDRSHRCATTLAAPTGKIKAIKRDDGSYTVLTEAQVASIDEGLSSKVIEPLAYVPIEEVATHTYADAYEVAGDRKDESAVETVAGLTATLAACERALIARVVSRGSQRIVALHEVDGKLMAHRLRYAQEIPASDPGVLAVASANVPTGATNMLDTLLSGSLPSTFDIGEVEDVTKTRKAAVIAAALEGNSNVPVATTAVAPTVTVDLMTKLKEAIDAKEAGKKPRKRTVRVAEGESVDLNAVKP